MAANFTSSATNMSLSNTYTGPAAQNVTIMAWIYITSTSPNTYRYICSQQGAGIALILGSGTVGTTANYGSDAINNLGRTVPINRWTHLAMTVRFDSVSRAYYTGYFNGQVDVRFDDSLRTYSTYTSWAIGNDGTGGAFPFNGRIRDVRVWGRALSGTEVWQNMMSMTPIGPSGMIFWLPLDQDLYLDRGSGRGENFTVGSAVTLAPSEFRMPPLKRRPF